MLNRLDRFYRGFGAALFLTVIGVGGTLLALTVFPLIAGLTREHERRRLRFQWVLHHSFRLYCAAIHAMRIAEIAIVGAERLRGLEGGLIVANHPSLLDVVLIMAAVPRVQCVVKGALWRNPFFRLTVEGAGYIRNDLDSEALMAACVATLKAGNNLIVFPEGTRTLPGQPVRLRRGFANIATLAEADVQIVTITCDPPVLNKGGAWWRVPRQRSRFRMEVGERLDIQAFMSYRFRPLGARKLVSTLEDFYREKLGHGHAGTGLEGDDRLGVEAGRSVA